MCAGPGPDLGPSLCTPAIVLGSNPSWILKPLWRTVAASGVSKSSTIEDLGFFKPLFRGVVASGGSKSSQIEDLGCFKPLLRGVVASGGSKSLKTVSWILLSLY